MTIQANNMWFGVLALIGGLGLFIFGMFFMSEGLQLAAGDRLRKMLERLTKTRVRGVMVGAGVTAVIQSSSATTVMLVGFVNAGLMTFTQSVAIIFGANIGTTVTAQIVAFKVQTLAFPLIGLGLILHLAGYKEKIRYIGQVILGFGFLFLGMELMKAAMYPLENSGVFENWIVSYGTNVFIGLLLGIIITSILQSSSATTGIVIAMAAAGALSIGGADPLKVAIPIILGCNIGTCITAFIASIGASLPAQRVAVAHYLFNIIGTLIFLPFIGYFPDIVRSISDFFGASPDNIARQVAWFHTLFNVTMTIVLLPFLGYFVKLVKIMKRGKEKEMPARDPLYLDPKIFPNPGMALEMAGKEVTRMSRLTLDMLKTSIGFFIKIDRANKKALLEEESIVDGLANSIITYLTRLSEETLTDEQSEQLVGLMHAVNDIERIGDRAENIMYLAAAKRENDKKFGEAAKEELKQISEKVFEMYEGIISSFENEDAEMAVRYQSFEHEIDEMASRFRNNHIKRQSGRECDLGAGVLFLDTLTNLERVGDLANNVGHVVTGALERL
ncbi:MAG: Na/Pi cotransporter family protein [Actinobacteria bacterium]|nr:Na/Pi cotransporter family protein [Actinomycetota bacterium]